MEKVKITAAKFVSMVLILLFVFASITGCSSNADKKTETDKIDDNQTTVNVDNNAGPVVNKERMKRVAGGFWPAPPGFGGNLIGAQVGDPGYYIYESMFSIIVGTDKVIPRLAKEWKHEGNKTTVVFYDNRKWSDGTPFTAKDLWAYYLININSNAITRQLEAINIVNDYTLEFVWAEPVVSDTQKMLYLAEGWQAVTPYHIFGKFVDEVQEIMKQGTSYTGEDRAKRPPFGLVFNEEQQKRLKDLYNEFKNVDMEKPIGTGPYMVDNVTNVTCDLIVNPYFPDSDKLEFQKIRMHTVSDYNSLLSSNGTDSFIGTLPYDMARNILDANKDMVMYPIQEQKSVGVIFNTRMQPLNDKIVRHALNEVINKKPIREIANYWGVETDFATTGLIPSTVDKYVSADALAKFDRYTGNAEKAAKMLEDAGWKKNGSGKWEDNNGRTYKFIIAANAGWGAQGITAASEIAEQLTRFGFDTEAKAVEATVVVSNMKDGAYDMLIDFVDMTWNISDPYKTFGAYYGDITQKAGIEISDENPLILKDFDGKDINVKEAIDSLRYLNNDDPKYKDLVGRLAWATNDNAIGINLYQNVMAIWENSATSKGLPMESEFEKYDRMMPLPRTPEEYEDIAVLNRSYAPYAEVFIRNEVKPK